MIKKKQIEQLPNAEFISPSGKLPIIQCGQYIISEPNSIIDFVKVKVRKFNLITIQFFIFLIVKTFLQLVFKLYQQL